MDRGRNALARAIEKNNCVESLESRLLLYSGNVLVDVSVNGIDSELRESKLRLEAELCHSVGLFCYPNGDTDARIRRAARRAGYRAAVTVEEGFNGKPCDLLALRRLHSETDFVRFMQRTSGFEQMKNRLRYALAKTASAAR